MNKTLNAAFLVAFTVLTSCSSVRTDNSNVFYAGKSVGADNNLTESRVNKDVEAAFNFKRRYPNGFVAIFGGSKLSRDSGTYSKIYDFAKKWSDNYGAVYPILTGAGPGAMEAGCRGAMDSQNKISIGYTTYYTDEARKDASKAYWQYEGKDIITDGLVFSSVSVRETMMILHSSAIIFSPGGTGTEWEIFQVLEMIKSNQLNRLPIYFMGEKQEWETFYNRISDLSKRGMLGKRKNDGSMLELTDFFKHVNDADDLVKTLKAELNIKD